METLRFVLVAYAALDGFDPGVGIIHHFVARNDEEKSQTLRSIGPVRDGNEVWLTAAMLGGAAFATRPYLLPATTNPSYGLTIYNSQTGSYSPAVGLVWRLLGVGPAVLYFGFLYRSFRGKVRLGAAR